MPPQPFPKAMTKKLIVRFRVICKERGYNLKKTRQIINGFYLNERDHVSLSTINKWTFDRIGICLNSETALAIKAFNDDNGIPKELSAK